MRVAIPLGFTLELADLWCDVTDDLPSGSPFTLALEDGVGAFQFSSALFRGGAAPNATADTLRQMLLSFGREKALGEPASVRVCHDNVVSVGASFKKEDSIRVWFISNGRNFVMATHTSGEDAPNEVAQCETMVRSIEFK